MGGENEMKKMEEQELKQVEGGGIGTWGVIGIIALGAFLVGLFDGIARPIGCND